MPASTIKRYHVTVRVVPRAGQGVPYAPSFNAYATVCATNAFAARQAAEREVSVDYPNARAVVATTQRRITTT